MQRVTQETMIRITEARNPNPNLTSTSPAFANSSEDDGGAA